MVISLTRESIYDCIINCQSSAEVDQGELKLDSPSTLKEAAETNLSSVTTKASTQAMPTVSSWHDSNGSYSFEKLYSSHQFCIPIQNSALEKPASLLGDVGSELGDRPSLSDISYSSFVGLRQTSDSSRRNIISRAIERNAQKAALDRCIKTYNVSATPESGQLESELDKVKSLTASELRDKMNDYMGTRLPISIMMDTSYLAVVSIGLLVGGLTPAGLVPILVVGALGIAANSWFMHRKMKYSMDGVMRVGVCKARGETFVQRASQAKPRGPKAPYKIARSYYRAFCEKHSQKAYEKVTARIKKDYPNLTKEQMDAVEHEASIYREGKGIEYWQKRLPTKVAMAILLGVSEFAIMAAFGATLVNPVTVALAATIVISFLVIKVGVMISRLRFSMLAASYAKISTFVGQAGADNKPIELKRSTWDLRYESHISRKVERVVNQYATKHGLSRTEKEQLHNKLKKASIRKSREIFKYRWKAESVSPMASGLYKILMVTTRSHTPIEAAARSVTSAFGLAFLSLSLYFRVHLTITGTAKEELREILDKRQSAQPSPQEDLKAAQEAAAEILAAEQIALTTTIS